MYSNGLYFVNLDSIAATQRSIWSPLRNRNQAANPVRLTSASGCRNTAVGPRFPQAAPVRLSNCPDV